MSGTALVVVPATSQQISRAEEWDPEQIRVLRDTYAKNLDDAEFALFGQVCRRTRLDPFRKQIYAIKRPEWDPVTKTNSWKVTFQTSIDGFRAIAARTGLDDGQSPPQWCGPDAQWSEIWAGNGDPHSARVTVYKKGRTHGFPGTARYSAYVQTTKDGSPTKMWKKMGAEQLAKCAEALALRKAFPEELGGVYTHDEMAQAGNEEITSDGEVVSGSRAPQLAPVPQHDPDLEALGRKILAAIDGLPSYKASCGLYLKIQKEPALTDELRALLLTQCKRRGLDLQATESAPAPTPGVTYNASWQQAPAEPPPSSDDMAPSDDPDEGP